MCGVWMQVLEVGGRTSKKVLGHVNGHTVLNRNGLEYWTTYFATGMQKYQYYVYMRHRRIGTGLNSLIYQICPLGLKAYTHR